MFGLGIWEILIILAIIGPPIIIIIFLNHRSKTNKEVARAAMEKGTSSDKEITTEKTPESPEERMQKLADMKEKGLISEEDYNSKKEEILKKLWQF